MVEQTREREGALILMGTIFAIAALIIGVGLAYILTPDKPAQASSLTHVTNVSVGSTSSFISVRKDNGVVVDLNPQQHLWGVRSVVVRNGTCITINGGAQRCGVQEIPLGAGNYLVRRTK